MDKLLDYWQGRNSREQSILALGGVILILFFLYLLVVNPLLNWRADEAKRLEGSQKELAQVQQLAAQIKAKQASSSQQGNKTNLSVLIDQTLRKNDLVMRGFQPGSNQDARLRLENAAYPSLAQWLYDLEYQHGINVQELSLTPAKVSGRLMVTLRVSQ